MLSANQDAGEEELVPAEDSNEDDEEDRSANTATFPFLNKIFGGPPAQPGPEREKRAEEEERQGDKKKKKKKFLDNYAQMCIRDSGKRDGYLEGPKYIVTWALGHLVTLAEPEAYGKQYEKWDLEKMCIRDSTGGACRNDRAAGTVPQGLRQPPQERDIPPGAGASSVYAPCQGKEKHCVEEGPS